MLGGAFELAPIRAGELGAFLGSESLIAVGPGITDPSFPAVAAAIVDPEVDRLLERVEESALATATDPRQVLPVVVTIAGVHYQLIVDELGAAEVRAKAPFDAADENEVATTASWLLERLEARLDDR